MSRPAPPAQRNLTLTEELEKLEQSITLTLQEIDSNFSRAHRIVTTSILPIVEQYAEHSRDVWEGAKFWKQFFEASANVSLSGYEEQPKDDSQQDQTLTTAEGDTNAATDTTHTTLNEAASYETPSSEHLDIDHRDEDIDLSSLTLSHSSTPRPHQKRRSGGDEPTTSSIPSYPSYEPTLHQSELGDPDTTEHGGLPTTPGKQHPQDISTTPTSSPLLPPAPSEHEYDQQSTAKKNPYRKASDPVLHRMLDKTYRVQATPLGKGGFGGGRTKFNVTPKDKPALRYPFDDSPISSPELEAPQLHEEIFSSPLKAQTPGRKPRSTSHSRVTPKPGISVLTPAKKSAGKGKRAVWDSDDDLDDDDDFGGYSPPKTMQFHIPQSRLMKTPAKEASKRIVTDLLATAGGDITSEYEEQSPSVIGRAKALEDETF